MSSLPLAALALFTVFHAHTGPRPSGDQSYELGRWRLDIHRDAFRQESRCRITDDYGHFPRVTVTPGVLSLKLPAHADGAQAWFSLDGAPARPWREVEAALIAEGRPAEAEALDNATGAMLPLPYPAVVGAKVISVQIRFNGQLAEFSTAGLWPLVDAGEQLGCRFRDGR